MKTIVKILDSLEMVGFVKSNGTQCRFVSMVSETPVKNLRAACPFKGVIKISRKQGLLNVNYNNAVCNRLAAQLGVSPKDVEYENGKVWYKHLMTEDGKALPLVVHATKDDGEYYIQYYPRHSENVYRLPNGDTITEEQLKPYFYKSNKEDFKPTVISIKVSNIKELRASGVIMQAEDLPEAEAILASA